MPKQPISRGKFEEHTGLVLEAVVDGAIVFHDSAAMFEQLAEEQRSWFVAHASLRLRYMYANKPQFRQLLRGSGNGGRDRCYTWVEHWLEAYLRDPQVYRERHSSTMFDGEETICGC